MFYENIDIAIKDCDNAVHGKNNKSKQQYNNHQQKRRSSYRLQCNLWHKLVWLIDNLSLT